MPLILRLLLVLLPLISFAVQAASTAPSKLDKLRPQGPVTVTADRAEFDKTGVMIYSGNVLLIADNLQLKGDRLELRQYPGDQYEAKLKGSLAHMEQSGEVDEKGQVQPPMLADGVDMLYDTRTGLLDIIGKAKAVRGKNEVSGNTIRYNVNERRVQASGGDGGQVKIIIQSPHVNEKPSPVEPAPAPKPSAKKPAVKPKASSAPAATPTEPARPAAEKASAPAVESPAPTPATTQPDEKISSPAVQTP